MDEILYFVRYETQAVAMANALHNVADSLLRARSGSDLEQARNRLLLLVRTLELEKQRHRTDLIQWAAAQAA